MLKRILKATQLEQRNARIIFYAREVSLVSGLFKVDARGRILDQGFVKILSTSEPHKHNRALRMIPGLNRVILNLVQQWRGPIQERERLCEPIRRNFNYGAIDEDPKLISRAGRPGQGLPKPDAGFVDRAFAPVTNRQISLGLRDLILVSEQLKGAQAFTYHVLRKLLSSRNLTRSSQPARYRSRAQQDLCLHVGRQSVDLWSFADSTPDTVQSRAGSFVVSSVFQFPGSGTFCDRVRGAADRRRW